jgi:hypothetical protein
MKLKLSVVHKLFVLTTNGGPHHHRAIATNRIRDLSSVASPFQISDQLLQDVAM